MIKGWTRKHSYIMTGGALAVAVLYAAAYFLLITPLKTEVEALNNQVELYTEQYDSLSTDSHDVKEEIKAKNLLEKVPSEKSPDDVLLELKDLAEKIDITISYLESGGQSVEQQYQEDTSIQEVVYLLDATAATLQDMNRFMEGILAADRLMQIDSIQLQQKSENVSLTLTFRVFYTESSIGQGS